MTNVGLSLTQIIVIRELTREIPSNSKTYKEYSDIICELDTMMTNLLAEEFDRDMKG